MLLDLKISCPFGSEWHNYALFLPKQLNSKFSEPLDLFNFTNFNEISKEGIKLATFNSGIPDWRVPIKSPGPRILRSSSAITKPLLYLKKKLSQEEILRNRGWTEVKYFTGINFHRRCQCLHDFQGYLVTDFIYKSCIRAVLVKKIAILESVLLLVIAIDQDTT